MTEKKIDLTIFNNLKSNECNNNNISNCNQLQRLMTGLKYYQFVNENKIDKDKFVHFCQIIYTKLLDDYFHFIKYHHYHLDEIKDELLTNQ